MGPGTFKAPAMRNTTATVTALSAPTIKKNLDLRRDRGAESGSADDDCRKTVFVLISFGGATNSPQRSSAGVGYLVQDVLHARGLR
jgi:hypothetical protein